VHSVLQPVHQNVCSCLRYSLRKFQSKIADEIQTLISPRWLLLIYAKLHFHPFTTGVSDHKTVGLYSRSRSLCYRPSICLSVVCRLSVACLSSVTFVRGSGVQAVQIFGNISTALGTTAIHSHPLTISRRSSQGNPFVGGVKHKRRSQTLRFRTYRRVYLGNGAR